MNIKSFVVCCAIFFAPLLSNAQVKIGGDTTKPDSKAILELSDTSRGFLLPRLTKAQMNAIDTPTNGLLVFNTTDNSIFQYKSSNSLWMPIRSDSSDWFLDTASKKLYLKFGLENDDSIYYHTEKKKFLFTDTRYYTLSGGSVFNLDEGNSDKYIFKVTASKFFRDTVNLNSANMYSIYEADNDTIAMNRPYEATYTSLSAQAVVTPGAKQKIGSITGLASSVGFGGQDSIQTVVGHSNSVSANGNGFIFNLTGLNNSTNISAADTANVGSLYGINNSMNYSSAGNKSKVEGNLYGYFLNIRSNFAAKVAFGSAYGVYLRDVTAATQGKNYSIYTSKGYNRFGDSTLITDLTLIKPRAILDINSNSAMILPVGTTAQRPALAYVGMLRYNSENSTPEAMTSTGWVNLKSPVLSSTVPLDFPVIAPDSTMVMSFGVPSAAMGNVVTVSPVNAMLPGTFIAYSRVVSPGLVEIAFGNLTAAPLDPPADNYNIRVIQ